MKKLGLLFTILLALSLPLLAEAGGDPGMPVEVQKVSLHLLKEDLPAIGVVKATQDIKVSSQYGGRIIQLNVRLGAYVKQNAIIASLRKKEAEALYDSGNRGIKDLNIRAPIAGYVAEIYSFPGEVATVGQPLIRLISAENNYLSLNLSGDFLSRIKQGTPLAISRDGQEYPSVIEAIIPVTDTASGTFSAIASLKTPKLYPGIACQVILHLTEKKALAVPRAAVLTREGEKIVFVIAANKAVRRVVETGIRTDKLIEITKGIKVGETVAILGNYELADGMSVRIETR